MKNMTEKLFIISSIVFFWALCILTFLSAYVWHNLFSFLLFFVGTGLWIHVAIRKADREYREELNIKNQLP